MKRILFSLLISTSAFGSDRDLREKLPEYYRELATHQLVNPHETYGANTYVVLGNDVSLEETDKFSEASSDTSSLPLDIPFNASENTHASSSHSEIRFSYYSDGFDWDDSSEGSSSPSEAGERTSKPFLFSAACRSLHSSIGSDEDVSDSDYSTEDTSTSSEASEYN